MDGFKERLNRSIQFKLSFALSLAILVVAVAAGIFSFVSAFDEAHELQDNTLQQVAALLVDQHDPLRIHFADTGGAQGMGTYSKEGRDNDNIEDARIIVQYLGDARQTGEKAKTKTPTDIAPPLPAALPDGLQTQVVGGKTFRLLLKTTASGARIAVAQDTDVRNEIARDSALHTLLPLLILVPILLLVVADLVRKMFRPITALSAEIDQRAEQALHPVEEDHLPVEVRPFVVAINRLLARVAQAMNVQRRFVADAAHELRSPWTAVSLQAQRLAQTEMSDPARERLQTLQRGVERGRMLLEQLLSLAKFQATSEPPASPTSVQSVYRRVLEDLIPLAEAKHIDMGVVGEQDAQVWVGESDLMAMVRNLVDNAIRYTPPGGTVDLSVRTEAACTVLQIKDSGPGIAAAQRERVFDPFYRILGSDQLGSGLGLSIVKAISDRIGAEVRLGYADDAQKSGLCASIRIPVSLPERA